ncbi:MAG: hypothetical protein JST65_14620 [Acidobacteria bacterium]|nr:hypothetical protein [Acidobacteriota bacterium]
MPRKSDDPKIHNLLVRVTPRQLEVFKAAAKVRHLSMASWARQTLMDEAARLLGEPAALPPENPEDL